MRSSTRRPFEQDGGHSHCRETVVVARHATSLLDERHIGTLQRWEAPLQGRRYRGRWFRLRRRARGILIDYPGLGHYAQ